MALRDLGLGVARGYATLGAIGFEGRLDYAALGTVTNLAARLCGEARPGQILVAPRVLAALDDLAEVEPLGELSLRGFLRRSPSATCCASEPRRVASSRAPAARWGLVAL